MIMYIVYVILACAGVCEYIIERDRKRSEDALLVKAKFLPLLSKLALAPKKNRNTVLTCDTE